MITTKDLLMWTTLYFSEMRDIMVELQVWIGKGLLVGFPQPAILRNGLGM